MAAAYETGTATDQTDLLKKLVTWLVAQGWTQNMSQADGSGWRAHLSKSSQYINLRAYTAAEATSSLWGTAASASNSTNGIGLYLGTGYSGASDWKSQAGRPVGAVSGFTLGGIIAIPSGTITAYHFFDDGADNINAVVEKSGGIFGAMGWGNLADLAGTITGGAFFYGSVPSTVLGVTGATDAAKTQAGTINTSAPCTYGSGYASVNGTLYAASYFRADVDTWTGKWIGTIEGGSSTYATGWGGMSSAYGLGAPSVNVPRLSGLQPRSANVANGRNVIWPIHFYAARTAGGYSLVGRVPNVFISGGTFSPASIVSIGGVNYMAFPSVSATNANATLVPNSFLIRKLA